MYGKALFATTKAVKISLAAFGLAMVAVGASAETGSLPDSIQQTAHTALSVVGVPAPHPSTAPTTTETGRSLQSFLPRVLPAPVAGDLAAQNAKDKAGAAMLGTNAAAMCSAAAGSVDGKYTGLTSADLQKLASAAGLPASEVTQLTAAVNAQEGQILQQVQQEIQGFCTRLSAAEQDALQGKVPPFPVPSMNPSAVWPTAWPSFALPSGLPSIPVPPRPTGPSSAVPGGGFPSVPPVHLPTNIPLPTGLPTNIPWPTNLPSIPMPTYPGGVSG